MYSTLCGKGQKGTLAKSSGWKGNEGQVRLECLMDVMSIGTNSKKEQNIIILEKSRA